jgi:hypothetical protein
MCKFGLAVAAATFTAIASQALYAAPLSSGTAIRPEAPFVESATYYGPHRHHGYYPRYRYYDNSYYPRYGYDGYSYHPRYYTYRGYYNDYPSYAQYPYYRDRLYSRRSSPQ